MFKGNSLYSVMGQESCELLMHCEAMWIPSFYGQAVIVYCSPVGAACPARCECPSARAYSDLQCDGRSPSPFSLGLLNLSLRRVVSEEVLAETVIPGGG